MLINKEHIVLEAGIEMRLKSQMYYNGIMVAINMRIHPVQTLEELAK